MSEHIWEGRLEHFTARVSRYHGRKGILTVTDDNSNDLLYRKVVALSFGARFGPDVADVEKWQKICSAFIDGYVKGEQAPEVEDIPPWDGRPTAAEQQGSQAEWKRLKQRLEISDTPNLDTTDPEEAMTAAFKTLGMGGADGPFGDALNELLAVAARILGDFQIHTYRDDMDMVSHAIFWQRRNRWVSGRNSIFSLARAIDYEIEKPYSFDASRDFADPDSEDARIRDAIVGLNRA